MTIWYHNWIDKIQYKYVICTYSKDYSWNDQVKIILQPFL